METMVLLSFFFFSSLLSIFSFTNFIFSYEKPLERDAHIIAPGEKVLGRAGCVILLGRLVDPFVQIEVIRHRDFALRLAGHRVQLAVEKLDNLRIEVDVLLALLVGVSARGGARQGEKEGENGQQEKKKKKKNKISLPFSPFPPESSKSPSIYLMISRTVTARSCTSRSPDCTKSGMRCTISLRIC